MLRSPERPLPMLTQTLERQGRLLNDTLDDLRTAPNVLVGAGDARDIAVDRNVVTNPYALLVKEPQRLLK
mgnify:CR=1 FL=1